jgi:hypothetical protein
MPFPTCRRYSDVAAQTSAIAETNFPVGPGVAAGRLVLSPAVVWREWITHQEVTTMRFAFLGRVSTEDL